jgi:NAD(P)-dependent dehydrogenase (short-subunit alcohol dehydrogenase family)
VSIRSAFVTGANRADGIGLALVRELAEHDAQHLVGTYRSRARARALLRLAASDARVHAVELDVTSDASVTDMAAWSARELGPLDLLVNNAGLGGLGDNVLTAPLSDLHAQVEAHAVGMLRVTRALRSFLHPGSVVLNVSSTLGSIATMDGSSAFYSVAKALQNALTRELAAALRRERVIVCAVSPGWVATSMGGRGAPLTPRQSAEHLVRLAERLTLADSGEFMEYDGSPLAW